MEDLKTWKDQVKATMLKAAQEFNKAETTFDKLGIVRNYNSMIKVVMDNDCTW